MLVVDLNALHTVNVLNLVDNVFLHSRRTHDVEDVSGSDGPVAQGSAGTHVVIFLNENLLRQGHEIFLHLAKTRSHGNLAVASFHLAQVDLAVNFGNDGGVARVAGLEELGNAGQTTGDVTGVAGCTRYLHEDIARVEGSTFVNHEVGSHRECVGLYNLACLVDNLGFGSFCLVLALDYDLLAQTGLFVGIHTVGDVFNQVHIFNLTAGFADDYGVEGVPVADEVAFLHGVAAAEVELRTVYDVGVCKHHAGVGVEDAHFGKTADDNLYLATLGVDFVGGHGAELVDFEDTVVARHDGVDGGDVGGHTTHVECTEGKLCTGLADGLRCNHAHSLAFLNQAVVGKVAAVALGAYAFLALAG